MIGEHQPYLPFWYVATFYYIEFLTLSWRSSLSYRNQLIDLVNWWTSFYDTDLRHERVNSNFNVIINISKAFLKKKNHPKKCLKFWGVLQKMVYHEEIIETTGRFYLRWECTFKPQMTPPLKACVRYFLSNFYFSLYDSPLKTMNKFFYFI